MNFKKFRTAGILFLVILALGGLATWDEWKTKKDDATKKTEKKLASFNPGDVVEIHYLSHETEQAAGQQASPVDVTVAKIEGAWHVVKPMDMLADSQTVDNLLKAIGDYQYEKVVGKGEEKLEGFGLKPAARELTLKFSEEGKTPLHIGVGAKAPVGFNVYSRSSLSDEIYIGGQQLLTATTKSLYEFRDKSLVKIDDKKVSAVSYSRKDTGLKLEFAKKEGVFKFAGALAGVEAESVELKDFLDELTRARVERFIDVLSDDEKKALADPLYTVSWTEDGGRSTGMVFTLVKDKLLTAFAAPIMTQAFELGDELKNKIKKSEADFRNRRILKISSDDITQVDVDGDSYKKVSGDWYKNEDAAKFEGGVYKGDVKAKPEPQTHIRAFLVDVEFAKTDEFLGPEDAVVKKLAAAPQHRIKLFTTKDVSSATTIDLFSDDSAKDKYFTRVSGSTIVYRVPKAAFSHMTPGEKTPDGSTAVTPEGPGPQDLPMNGMPALDGDEAPIGPEGGSEQGLEQPDTGH